MAIDYNPSGGTDVTKAAAHVGALAYDFDDPFTISAWQRTSSTNAVQSHIYGQQKAIGNLRGWAIQWVAGNIRFDFRNHPTLGITVQTTSSAYNDGNWNHICITYSGNNLASGVTIYVNGVDDTNGTPIQDTLSTNTTIDTASILSAGARGDIQVLPHRGSIAETAVWGVVLNANEIASLSRGVNADRIRRGSLDHHWTLQGGLTTENDLSGNIVQGTTSGASISRVSHAPVQLRSNLSRRAFFDVVASAFGGGSMTTRCLSFLKLY